MNFIDQNKGHFDEKVRVNLCDKRIEFRIEDTGIETGGLLLNH
jgi:hypothetical protein